MKELIIILVLSGCSLIHKSQQYSHIMIMTIELLDCNGHVFEKHTIHDFQRNSGSVQWQCDHGLVIYNGKYRVIKH